MPEPSIFLTGEWRYLAMLNYVVDPELLAPFVPPGTELDLHDDRAYLSVVGFMFYDTRLMGIPVPFHQDFEEVNLRFYVRREADGELRRGVVFIREFVPKPAIAAIARKAYNEKYTSLPMRSRIETENGALKPNGAIEYGWKVNKLWNTMTARTVGDARPIEDGSHEEFITEHYWGYVAQRDGHTVEYRVEHPRWNVWRTSDATLDCNVADVYGEQFVAPLGSAPASAFVAEGSSVTVRRGILI
jgi:uncharacterized protein YqjF (DUF2071 family)